MKSAKDRTDVLSELVTLMEHNIYYSTAMQHLLHKYNLSDRDMYKLAASYITYQRLERSLR